MVSRSLVLGYHGCDAVTAKKLVNGIEKQIPSDKPYDWLGNGFYFWEDSYSRAFKWAQDVAKIKGSLVNEPAVVGAILDLGNCLNLIDAESLELVKAAHKAYLNLCQVSGLKPAQNKGKDLRARYLDMAVFETLHKLRQDEKKQAFDSVRAFFVEGEPLYENAGLHTLDHIQICIRNPNNILGYFLPRGMKA